jgi:hypothetical protein
MQSILDFANQILDFIHNGIYGLITHVFSNFIAWFMVGVIKSKIFAMTFAWAIAKQVLDQLQISTYLSQAWASLDYQVLMLVTYLRLPDALNIVLSARLTRFVMDFIGL